MTNSSKSVLVQDRLALTISASLLLVALGGWVASYYLMPLMMKSSTMLSYGVAAIVSSSFSFGAVSIFELVWIVGMAAMMFPAMIPVVLLYNRVAVKQLSSKAITRAIGTTIFLSGYLVLYAILGFGAHISVYFALNLSTELRAGLALYSVFAASAILVLTGVYQLSTLKSRCLSQCVSPFGFFAVHYKSGLWGSLWMGLRHGVYCVGCCWMFMLVMFAIGAMSLPVMAALAGVIALEKVLLWGATWFSRLVAIGFISLGIGAVLFPSILGLI